uniref:Ig-like domain-containing protein n=1 Tax=Myripristis murdjan TaxID=586833 RepID=A0A667X745_9TELE
MHGSAEEGGHVRFTCSIATYDKSTQVSWYFGNRQLHPSPKYEISYSNGFASIYVKDIEESDDGVYRCKVVKHFVARSIKKLRKKVDKTKLLKRPPEFTLPLYNRTAYIGEDVRFGVTITVPGDNDSKYTFISDKGLYQLIIHNLDMDDDAEYTVMAHNKFGEDSCKARLTVTPHPVVEDTMRPMFKRLLANIECVEGQSAMIQCVLTGSTPLNVVWLKDTRALPNVPTHYQTYSEKNKHILEITQLESSDQGVYVCEASNNAGTAVCSMELRVIDKPSFVKPLGSVSAVVGTPLHLECEVDEDTGAPLFSKRVESATAVLGNTVKLQGTIKGSAPITVKWLKDSEILRDDDPKVKMAFENNVASLAFSSVEIRHGGKYTCLAENEAGHQKCEAILTIQG